VRERLGHSDFSAIRWVSDTGSTNKDLLGLIDPALPQVLVTDHQRRGRGRRDRAWDAPPGSGLLFSVMIRPTVRASEAHLVTHAMAIAAAEAAGEVSGAPVALKWPNDLVVRGAGPGGVDLKCAGILAESRLVGSSIDVLVVGTGINVNFPMMPAELTDTATALNLVAGREIDREELLVLTLRRFAILAAGLESPATVRELYRRHSATLGQRVRVQLEARSYEGTALDVSEAGHLMVADDHGSTHEVTVADVVHLRPVH